MNKKSFIKILFFLVCVIFFENTIYASPTLSKKTIVCTTFSEYDWIKNIVGNNIKSFNLYLLQKNGTDLHSFQPTFTDIAEITSCDLFIFTSNNNQNWITKLLKNNKSLNFLDLIDVLKAETKILPLIHEHEIHEEHQHNHEHHDETEYDEHIWLSLINAKLLISEISNSIQKIDSENSELYIKNTNEYLSKINLLEQNYQESLKNLKNRTLICPDRFPFRYLARDYDLIYFAAFNGCSAESEASFEKAVFLSKKINELNCRFLIVSENADKKLAESIIFSTKQKNQSILVLDSLQSVTTKQIKDGKNYLTAMNNNLEVLLKALQ